MLPTLKKKKEDPRVTRTRRLLEQAFMELVDETGFDALSVQEITDQAGINRATFYAHFPDKYALLDHSIRMQFAQELEARTLNVCTFSMENLRALIQTVGEFTLEAGASCKVHSQQFEGVMEAQIIDQVQELIENWLVKMQAEGELPAEVDVHLSTVATSWAIYGLAQHWRQDKKRPPSGDFAGQVLPMMAVNLGVRQAA